jgi:hypothetical protein
MYRDNRIDSFRSLKEWPVPPLDGNPTPLTFRHGNESRALTFEALKYTNSGNCPKTDANSSEVSSLLTNLATLKSLRALAYGFASQV